MKKIILVLLFLFTPVHVHADDNTAESLYCTRMLSGDETKETTCLDKDGLSNILNKFFNVCTKPLSSASSDTAIGYRESGNKGSTGMRRCATMLASQATKKVHCLSGDAINNVVKNFWRVCTLPASFAPSNSLPLIPKVLIGFPEGISRQQYINIQLYELKKFENGEITKEAIEKEIQKEINDKKERNTKRWLSFDKNKDNKITYDELAKILSNSTCISSSGQISKERCDENIQKDIARRMDADLNQDEIITIEEMALPPRYEQSIRRNYEKFFAYLALDTNQDGKLTILELTDIAKEAFSIFDTDMDGILSLAEERNASASLFDAEGDFLSQYPATLPDRH